jgi:hypothetical protein
VLNLIKTIGITSNESIWTITGSVILSIILVKFVGGKVERIRQKRVKIQAGVTKWQLHQPLTGH